MNEACELANLPKAMKDMERERIIYANEVYCKACEENGIKVCSLENFSAWRDYMNGKIGESELSERAQEELKDFRQTFSKYTIVSKEEEKASADDDIRKHRAGFANKIYKEVCSDSGLSPCFFNNFAAWSDYVRGSIGEVELMARARAEAAKMLETKQ